MKTYISRFTDCEDGAVTVDWVVLTAALIGMTLVVVGGIRAAATDPADSVGAALTNQEIG